jgi:hypothetical protein
MGDTEDMADGKQTFHARLGQTLMLAALVLGALPGQGAAQTRRVIRADAPQALVVPVSARATAMGGSYLAGDDADVLFFNPAALVGARGLSLQGGGYTYSASLLSTAGATTIGRWTIGIGARALRWQDVAAQTGFSDNRPVDPNTTEPPQFGLWRSLGRTASAVMSVGAARRLFGFNVGGAFHVGDDFGSRLFVNQSRSGGAFFDLAASKAIGPGAFSVVAQHLGPDPTQDQTTPDLSRVLVRRAPSRVMFGYGVPLLPLRAHLDLGGNVLMSVERDGFVTTRGGVEAGYAPVDGVSFVGRLGTVRRRESGLTATFGAGLLIDRIGIDVSVEPDGDNPGWRIGMRIR